MKTFTQKSMCGQKPLFYLNLFENVNEILYCVWFGPEELKSSVSVDAAMIVQCRLTCLPFF